MFFFSSSMLSSSPGGFSLSWSHCSAVNIFLEWNTLCTLLRSVNPTRHITMLVTRTVNSSSRCSSCCQPIGSTLHYKDSMTNKMILYRDKVSNDVVYPYYLTYENRCHRVILRILKVNEK